MIKTNILRYTWLNIERVEATILLYHECEVLMIDSLIEELKTRPQYTQAIPAEEGFPGPTKQYRSGHPWWVGLACVLYLGCPIVGPCIGNIWSCS